MLPFLQFGTLIVPTYYLLISVGSVLGLAWYLARMPKKEEGVGINIAFVTLISGFLGARLFHIAFEAPSVYAHDPLRGLEFWQGGFVFYGGLLTAIGTGTFYCLRRGYGVLVWLDRASLPVGLAYAIGRIGCFLNGCCYGQVCHLPWAVHFPSHAVWGMAVQPRHPTQLYAAGLEGATILILYFLERKKVFRFSGLLFWYWLALHAMNRLVMENWRDDDRGSYVLGMSVSSMISLLLLGASAGALSARLGKKSRPAAGQNGY